MQAGNAHYRLDSDLPKRLALFPLTAALLLPGGRIPLNIFEPRYLQMIDDAMSGSRLIGMIQPSLDGNLRPDGEPTLCPVGCIGRITSLAETGDGRYLISLQGVCRFRVTQELVVTTLFRQCKIASFAADLGGDRVGAEVDRPALLKAFHTYLKINELEADWESISRTDTAILINTLSMMAPYGESEKHALL